MQKTKITTKQHTVGKIVNEKFVIRWQNQKHIYIKQIDNNYHIPDF